MLTSILPAPDYANQRLAEIGRASVEGLAALQEGKFDTLGSCMNTCQHMLAELGVSSDGLDIAIHRAREAGASGAKLSGGGGGGATIAIGPDPKMLMEKLGQSKFNVSTYEISNIGAMHFRYEKNKAKSV